tara:strand:- start:115 stop:543 length:429 start_codon:yes stop_codon:yes gene_type:complete
MPAAEYNFNIEKGTAFVISFEYKDDNELPINLTNWCARLRWKDNNDSIVTFNSNHTGSDYEFVIDPLVGKISLRIPASVTAAYTFTSASYDLELQEPNDLYSGGGKKVFRILAGTINTIERNVADTDSFNCNFDSQDDCETC